MHAPYAHEIWMLRRYEDYVYWDKKKGYRCITDDAPEECKKSYDLWWNMNINPWYNNKEWFPDYPNVRHKHHKRGRFVKDEDNEEQDRRDIEMRKILFAITMIVLLNISGVANANTDDAKVLGGLSAETDLYDYLNGYNYRIWKSDHRYSIHDMYINKDNSVIVDVWDGRLGHVYIIKPNYTTDKGVAVGMNLQEIVNTYGQYDEVWKSHSGNYTGYITVEYISDSNEGLSFVLNKYTKEIVLIRYQKNRHGNTLAMNDVEKHNMLPYLK